MTQCLAHVTEVGHLLHAGGDTFPLWLLMTGLQKEIRRVLGTDQQRGTFVVRPCLGLGPQFFSGLGRYRATCSGSLAFENAETTGVRHARAQPAEHLPSGCIFASERIACIEFTISVTDGLDLVAPRYDIMAGVHRN